MTPKAPDFFADLFNPPAKVTPPLRPAMPTPLPAYGGLRLAAKADVADYKFDGASGKTRLANVAANEFVVDGEYGGGWGAFTMGLLEIGEDMRKSFGAFGWKTVDGEKHSYSQMAKHMCHADKI